MRRMLNPEEGQLGREENKLERGWSPKPRQSKAVCEVFDFAG